jgi:hypothetical protein
MYLQKVISRKNCVKNWFFAGILKVNEENSRIRIQGSKRHWIPNPQHWSYLKMVNILLIAHMQITLERL